MALSDSQAKALIVAQVGDTPGGLVAAQIDALWALYDGEPSSLLHFLYTKREAVELLLGDAKRKVDTQDPVLTLKRSTEAQRLVDLLAALTAEIAVVVSNEATSIAPASGALTTTAPIAPPPGRFDGNSPDYRGSVYTTRRRRL